MDASRARGEIPDNGEETDLSLRAFEAGEEPISWSEDGRALYIDRPGDGKLRDWCLANMRSHYVPEELLEAWLSNLTPIDDEDLECYR
jgi:hypothetical protein